MRIMQVAAALVLVLAGAAGSAQAQFTAAVIPPERAKTTDTTARVDSVRKHRQAVVKEQMSSMKAWVDSAALALASSDSTGAGATTELADTSSPPPAPVQGGAAAETTSVAASTGRRDSVTVSSSGEVESAAPDSGGTVRAGTPAPATATSLPLFTLIGAGLLVTGAALLRR